MIFTDPSVCRKAEGGETFPIALEVYGGTPLPAHPSRPVFPEEGVTCTRSGPVSTGRSTFGWWNEEAYQLWLDLTVLRDVHDYLAPHDGFREALADGFARMLGNDVLDEFIASHVGGGHHALLCLSLNPLYEQTDAVVILTERHLELGMSCLDGAV